MIIVFKYILILIIFLYCTPKFENSADIVNQDRLLEALIFSSELLVNKQNRVCNNYHFDSNYEFKDNNDGTIYYIQSKTPPDNCEKLKVTWKKCSQGQTYSNGTCLGSPTPFIYCENSDVSKCSTSGILSSGPSFQSCSSMKDKKWRVPSVSELYILRYCSNGTSYYYNSSDTFCTNGSVKPTINSDLFPNTAQGNYWTSELDRSYSNYYGYVYSFLDGKKNGYGGNTTTAYVRCIADD
jgi:hypothetical protein